MTTIESIVEALKSAKESMLFDDIEVVNSIRLRDNMTYIMQKLGLEAWVVCRDDILHPTNTSRPFTAFCFDHPYALFVDRSRNELVFFTTYHEQCVCNVIQTYIKTLYSDFTLTIFQMNTETLTVPSWLMVIWFMVVLSNNIKDISVSVSATQILNKEKEDKTFISQLNVLCTDMLNERDWNLRGILKSKGINVIQKVAIAELQVTSLCKAYMKACHLQLLKDEHERSSSLYTEMKPSTNTEVLKRQIKLSWKMSLENIQRPHNSLEYSLRVKSYNPCVFVDTISIVEHSLRTHYTFINYVYENILLDEQNSVTTTLKEYVTTAKEQVKVSIKNIDIITSLMKDILFLAYSKYST